MKQDAAFLSEFRVLDVAEGRETRRLRLLEPFRVRSAVLQDEIVVPAGFEFDGESIPVFLHVVAPPFGQSKRGACVHDWLYRNHGYRRPDGSWREVDRKTADAVYHELVRLKGLPGWRANVRWAVLRLAGWVAWSQHGR